MVKLFLNIFFIFFTIISFSQTSVFKENGKWGIKENNQVIIQAVHDTIFNFDSTGKICLACTKLKSLHPNKYIKTPVISFHCSYINKSGKKLVVKSGNADSISDFSLLKNTVQNYRGNGNVMTVATKDKDLHDLKHLVDKDFNQITSAGYEEIHFSKDPMFLIASKRNENNVIFEGLINKKEEEIIPFRYSHVSLNTKDSLIIGCTAGQGSNSEDDIFDYTGKKVGSSRRHIELATKKYMVYKIFIPKEYLIIVNLANMQEQIEYAEEVKYHTEEQILMANDGNWFTYDLNTKKKKSYDTKHKK